MFSVEEEFLNEATDFCSLINRGWNCTSHLLSPSLQLPTTQNTQHTSNWLWLLCPHKALFLIWQWSLSTTYYQGNSFPSHVLPAFNLHHFPDFLITLVFFLNFMLFHLNKNSNNSPIIVGSSLKLFSWTF